MFRHRSCGAVSGQEKFMGTDVTHAGLPVSYRTVTASTVQPTCRAISLDELTRRGPVVVLAHSIDEIGAGAAGMLMATLETSYAHLFTLDGSAPGEHAAHPRLHCCSLQRVGTPTSADDVDAAVARVHDTLDRSCADSVFVGAVPVTSPDHRFLDLVARRTVADRPGTAYWYFAAMRRTPPGASYLLHPDAIVRTFDVRRWSDRDERLSTSPRGESATRTNTHLPELFWRNTDVSALARIDTAPA